MRWFWILYSNVACLLVIVLVPRELLVLRTFGTVLLSTGGIGGYLYFKYRWRFPLTVDVLTSAGMMIQFIIPSLYLSTIWPNEYWASVLVYRDFYPDVAFITLLGQSLFFLGYEATRKKTSNNFKLKLYLPSPRSFVLVLLPLVVAVWSSRFILLNTGSYYQLVRTEFMEQSYWYSILAQISSYGIYTVAGTWLFYWLVRGTLWGKRWLCMSSGFTMMEFLWYFPSGSREPVLALGIAILFAYIFVRQKIPFKWIIGGILIGLLSISALDFYRYSISYIADPRVVKIDQLQEAMVSAKYGFFQDWVSGNWLTRSLARISDAHSIAAILDGVPEIVPYLYGETYAKIPFVFIPRFIYPLKPELNLPINRWFFQLAGGSSPTTLIGEAYLNFGWLGIFIVMPIMGWISRIYDVFFEARINDPIWATIYIGMGVVIVRLPVQPAAVWISIFLKAMLLAILLVFWRRLLRLQRYKRF
jgi:hypothetical protein